MTTKNGHRDERELLEQDRGGEGDGGPDVARARERARTRGARRQDPVRRPCRTTRRARERVRRERARRPPAATAAARRRGAPRRSSRASPAGRATGSRRTAPGRAPRRRRQRGAGEVGEVSQRDLRALVGGGPAAVAAVEALEAAARVVVAVRAVTVPHELAGELDLVGRVVHVEPRLESRRAGRPGAASRARR